MYIRMAFVAALMGMVAAATPRPASAGSIGYVLGNGGTTLHAFHTDTPGTATTIVLGGAVNSLDDIDFRPLTGQLYGYVDSSDEYVIIDVKTGNTTLASSSPVVPTNTSRLGIDFNPTIDRARVVTELETNIVFNPNDGSTTLVNDLFYVAGDPNEGANPQVVANGYTNSLLGIMSDSTVQYVLDSDLDILAILGNNAGTLTTVGSLGVDFTEDAGLDIFFDPSTGTNMAFALLNTVNSNNSALYTIDLTTGAATLVGDFGSEFGTITGLAVTPVPEPSTLAMLAIGAVAPGVMILRRRRRRESAT
ncbi:DUF4394 domain-containing protein [Tautonia sp. JC769]|uniref:DUF4394 domain-containing protein n=1 Tax=Tautonia sp. JC769 TaxID=3232135 RepID=UPI0034599B53